MSRSDKGVLVLYTGGTIGSMPADPNDPESPQRVVDWDTFLEMTPQLDPKLLNKRPDHIGFKVDSWSLEPPLDSCNVTPDDWLQMAQVIYDRHDDYEGFVIAHGTDTMVYTASALSFMLINLKKPVIITGAQRSHTFLPRNDGLQNLLTACHFANPKRSKIPVVPEVCIYFGGELFRGNRCRKMDSEGYDAYFSPNYPSLGHAGGSLEVNEKNILPIPKQALQLRKRLNTGVVTFDVFPGIQNSHFVERMIDSNEIKGVVIRSFGSGNIPTAPKFLENFQKANDNGIVIQNVTQCVKGAVSLGIYETSAALLEIGMITGFDATPEAALCKLMVLLGDEDLSKDEVATLGQQCLAGEMSSSVYVQKLKEAGANRIDSKEGERKRLAPAEAIGGSWQSKQISNASLRLYGGEVNTETDSPVEIDVYINVGSDDELHHGLPNYAGSFKRRQSDGKFIISFDITTAAKALIQTGDRVSVTTKLNGQGSVTWQRAEIALFINETD